MSDLPGPVPWPSYRRRRARRSTGATRSLAGALTCLAVVGAGAPTSYGAATARAAHTLKASDTARMHRVHCSSCNEVLEEGEAKGSLPGTVRAFVTVGAPIIFHFTIMVRGGGSLSGEGAGKPKGNPAEPSFAGTMTVTRGTGRYSHARGSGGFYGTINRATYRAVMQTTGTLSY